HLPPPRPAARVAPNPSRRPPPLPRNPPADFTQVTSRTSTDGSTLYALPTTCPVWPTTDPLIRSPGHARRTWRSRANLTATRASAFRRAGGKRERTSGGVDRSTGFGASSLKAAVIGATCFGGALPTWALVSGWMGTATFGPPTSSPAERQPTTTVLMLRNSLIPKSASSRP